MSGVKAGDLIRFRKHANGRCWAHAAPANNPRHPWRVDYSISYDWDPNASYLVIWAEKEPHIKPATLYCVALSEKGLFWAPASSQKIEVVNED